jgi:formate-dependent nitrite reductase membrane component NrfD
MTSRLRPRPRFQLLTHLSPAEVRDAVQQLLRSNPRVRGIAFEHRLEIAIAAAENHFYSPQLVVRVTQRAEGGSLLHARFGPDPYVWAFYLLGIGLLAIVTFVALIFGAVQLSLDQSPTAFLVAPLAALVGGLVYGASFVGQGFGYAQMHVLRAALTEAVHGVDRPD